MYTNYFADVLFGALSKESGNAELVNVILVELHTVSLNKSIYSLLDSKAILEGPSQLICVMCSEECLQITLRQVRKCLILIY